jgi:hypothetical protein
MARLASQGVTKFGFFGSSLGSFILYTASAVKSLSCAGEYLTPVAILREVCGIYLCCDSGM